MNSQLVQPKFPEPFLTSLIKAIRCIGLLGRRLIVLEKELELEQRRQHGLYGRVNIFLETEAIGGAIQSAFGQRIDATTIGTKNSVGNIA